MPDKLILKVLEDLKIEYERVEHPPVFTVSEAKAFGSFEADGCKNLFLYDKKADKHYLVVMLEDKKAHSNTIRKQVKARSLVFGSEEELKSLLGVTPGSVSPLGIVNDRDRVVTVLIDEDLPCCSKVCFHPNINTSTLIMKYSDFERFIQWCGNEYRFICVTN
ncbi:Ala-tRNA(Pro) deacylase [Anaerobacterium chartisolvens]|uniref:Ala-tRNA(Pro) deacylase n=1 Tax=Anaerobacterium chartisolvens TaxID=1297424 RepID=A0A369BHN6_9FIRM|nr:prolyl-tRNA synthetase associated domain-containing protein [Anaerobacterium chartisolvens]RCX21082.1 Ala-tRNA(Pro) deacylase [Anaerobacterium chartisolvens]